jgi:tRNA threonylcarbamoyladenosine biosynthesis protein TsaB
MILGIRTDQPEATVIISDGDREVARDQWLAGRALSTDLIEHVRALITDQKLAWKDIDGLVVFAGPGSFTGLRIGATVMNAIAYSDSTPIIGTTGDDWLSKGITQLNDHKDDKQVVPNYGSEPNITKPGLRK